MKKLATIIILSFLSLVTMAREWEGNNNGRWGGCVVEGTLITLINGSQKPIEKILESDRILTTTNESFKPLLRVRGPENKPLYLIQTSNNKEVIATEGHPFISVNHRILISKELKKGMVIQTSDGPETITNIGQSESGKIVYNLILSSDETLNHINEGKAEAAKMGFTTIEYQRRLDPFLGLTSFQHSYYVNGIASGDLLIQHSIEN